MVSGIETSIAGKGPIQNMLQTLRKGEQEASSAIVPETLASSGLDPAISGRTADSSNVMARNFASAEREESKYIKAHQAGQNALSNQANRQNAILNSAMVEVKGLDDKGKENYAILNLIGKKAARRVLEERQQTVSEETERNLDEIKREMEKKTQEATVPRDENGEPIKGMSSENVVETPPMPEVSSSNSSPASEAAASPAPAIEAVQASETSSAPTPPINIVV